MYIQYVGWRRKPENLADKSTEQATAVSPYTLYTVLFNQ